jgi:hypothetical protein
MKEILVLRTENITLHPDQIFILPDHIADQLIARGSGKLVEPVVPIVEEKPKKTTRRLG